MDILPGGTLGWAGVVSFSTSLCRVTEPLDEHCHKKFGAGSIHVPPGLVSALEDNDSLFGRGPPGAPCAVGARTR